MTGSGRPRSRKRKRPGLLRAGMTAAGEAIARNPGLAGGATAFAVTFLFVAANAIWYQPHPHRSAFFETRERPAEAVGEAESETVILIEREPPAADPAVEKVQRALARLELYADEVDGLAGPRTRAAVEEYQRVAGIEVTGEIDAALIARLEAGAYTQPATAPGAARPAVTLPEAAPLPRDLQVAENTASLRDTPPLPLSAGAPDAALGADADPRVVRIQAGLRAFGNDGVEIDGVVGPRTSAAIREFQSLFGLPVTGQPDDALYAKMQEIGLTN